MFIPILSPIYIPPGSAKPPPKWYVVGAFIAYPIILGINWGMMYFGSFCRDFAYVLGVCGYFGYQLFFLISVFEAMIWPIGIPLSFFLTYGMYW